ncbi:MAG: hypothetical protein MK211_02400 [Flavobacteriales bacterium]|jgi:magnesium-transporting ATPase (P-type)|uniref:hypothetical protein n=1 Tax=Candidatus Ulvibacter alkanivorans TaxID=2267620 RepID=UPI000DF1D09F|nr:hypothetical protein [Candidatus Ulvibacter alkanivorans]MCH2488978.1 hypothetical protein [Flavobacteriales bacterium]
MNKQNSKSKETKSLPHKTGRKNLFIGGVIVLLIAITPFLFYSYKNFPNDSQVWENSLFTVNTAFGSINTYMWFLVGKVVPLYLLLLWFFTCKHWWHWIILVPIAMYAFQLWGILNESQGLDELEIYYILPLMLVIIPAVYLIRAKLFNKMRLDDLDSFERDLMEKKTIWQQVKELFR